MKYFFRLGKNPNISLAEIESVLRRYDITFELLGTSVDIALIDTDSDLAEAFTDLGGSIKYGVVMTTLKDFSLAQAEIVSHLNALPFEKVFFGISTISTKVKPQLILKLGMTVKKEITKSARLVSSKDAELSSVIVQKEKLIKQGAEFIFFDIKNELYLGRTLGVQDFKEFGQRDFDRPGFDPLSGMLPPKLARMMCNLAEIKNKEAVILDPFCGSGTVLGELLSLGYTKIIGTDISQKAIDDTKQNLAWMHKEYNSNIKNVTVQVCDAQHIGEFVKSADVVVTEPFLGMPLRGGESVEQIAKIQKELKELYKNSLREIRKIIPVDARVVVIVPAIRTKKNTFYLDVLKDFVGMGYSIKDDYQRVDGSTERSPLTYSRPNQHVVREVVVLDKI